MKLLATIAALLLTGCYNLVVINLGVGNKTAAALAAPIDIEAFCAALQNRAITLNTRKTDLDQQAELLCETVNKKTGEKTTEKTEEKTEEKAKR